MSYIIAIGAYLFLLMIFGLVFAHKYAISADDMVTGGHRIPFIILVGSLLATWCGGGGINDTLIHLATSEMPFGGFGESGMGSYHGKTGFDTFTHYKSIVYKKTWLDLPMRYQPYKKINNKLLHMFLK